jgi:hypothetical protein
MVRTSSPDGCSNWTTPTGGSASSCITPRQCRRPVVAASLSQDQVRETLLWEGSMIQLPSGASAARPVVVSTGLLRSRSMVMTTPEYWGLIRLAAVRLAPQLPLELSCLVLGESVRPGLSLADELRHPINREITGSDRSGLPSDRENLPGRPGVVPMTPRPWRRMMAAARRTSALVVVAGGRVSG